MIIRRAVAPEDIATVREIWREYWESFRLSLDFQGFGRELDGLPGPYGAEGGVLLLALEDEAPAGTIALRRLDHASGEIKRLYLRPEFRGRGSARRLVEAVIEQARGLGYECLYADTLPVMTDALALYERLGFSRAAAYSADPTPGAIYLKLQILKAGRGALGSPL